MELTAFKNMPDELIRLIMEYARPTYKYLPQLKVINSPNHQDIVTEFKSYIFDLVNLRNSIPTHSIYRIYSNPNGKPQYSIHYSCRNGEYHPHEGQYNYGLQKLLYHIKDDEYDSW